VSFAVKIICVAFQLVFIVVSVYFVIDSVRKLLAQRKFYHWVRITSSQAVKGT